MTRFLSEVQDPRPSMWKPCVHLSTEEAEMRSKGTGSAMTLSDYMTLARELQACCRHLTLTKVKGTQKLERMIGTEIKFFQTLSQKDEATQAAHLQSSNLSHFAAIVHAATHLPGVIRVMRPFTSPDRQHNLLVDVVADQGRSWVKVVARKGQALHLVWAGQGQYGERDMVQQLKEYTECARHHPVNFQPPHVHAMFYNTLTTPMARVLQEEGVTVWGQVVPVDPAVMHKLKAVGDEEDEDTRVEDDNFFQIGDGSVGDIRFDGEADDVEEDNFDHGLRIRSAVEETVCVDDSDICLGVQVRHGVGGQTKDQRVLSERGDDLTHGAAETRHCSEMYAVPFKTRTVGELAVDSPNTRSLRDTRTLETGSDLDSCDLETDSVQEEADTHRLTQTRPTRSLTAWTLSARSNQCLPRILASCPDFSSFDCQSTGTERTSGGDSEKVNLDITTLITLVSSVCHGGCHLRFKDKVLDQQAAEERRHPSLPDLQAFLQDKEWLACRTAWSDFNGIVQLLGGPAEKKRAAQLLNRVTIVDDQMSARASNLRLKGKIKDRSKVVFGTGDHLQAVTVTANSGFLRAAENQGVSFAVHVHPARALTEQKESSASPALFDAFPLSGSGSRPQF